METLQTVPTKAAPKAAKTVTPVKATKAAPKAAKTVTPVKATKAAPKQAPVKTVKAKNDGTSLTPYQQNVINVNKSLKAHNKTLGGARKLLLSMADDIGLNPLQIRILKRSKLPENYPTFKKYVRSYVNKKTKAVTYCPFYILQALHTNGKKLQDAFAANAKK
tara:strand:- start:11428 stop:11916 length:489 start_codon:yes stop_codon:yes gene_type:complete